MKKHLLAIMLCSAVVLSVQAQSAVTITGGMAADGVHTMTYSVGQTAVTATPDGGLREGVVQPYIIEKVSVPENLCESSDLTVYPNPTLDGVTLRSQDAGRRAEVRLFALDGRLLRTEEWTGESLRLDLSALPTGVYMLKVNNITYKITKQ